MVAILVAAMAAATIITVAFGGDDSHSPGVVVEWIRGETTPRPSPTMTTTAAPTLVATATPDATGFSYPIAGACLPESDDLMPNAPRPYRKGIHEGVDFYDFDNCASIGVDTDVLAAKAGQVIRADWGYAPLTADQLAEIEQRVADGHAADPDVEDTLRGRQVWIDHGGGIVTRYAHLDGIADGIDVGAEVQQGQLVAYVGDSGTPESLTAPLTEIHLHFEIRVGDTYLAAALPPDAMRQLYQEAFAQP